MHHALEPVPTDFAKVGWQLFSPIVDTVFAGLCVRLSIECGLPNCLFKLRKKGIPVLDRFSEPVRMIAQEADIVPHVSLDLQLDGPVRFYNRAPNHLVGLVLHPELTAYLLRVFLFGGPKGVNAPHAVNQCRGASHRISRICWAFYRSLFAEMVGDDNRRTGVGGKLAQKRTEVLARGRIFVCVGADDRWGVYAAPRLVFQTFEDRLASETTKGTLASALMGVAARWRNVAVTGELNFARTPNMGFGNTTFQSGWILLPMLSVSGILPIGD